MMKIGFQSKVQNRYFANSVDPYETAHYEPSHLDLNCLHGYMYLFGSTRLKGLTLREKLVESSNFNDLS